MPPPAQPLALQRCSAFRAGDASGRLLSRRRGTSLPPPAGFAAHRRQRRQTTLVVRAVFDLPLNWNHTDWLKVPRGQAQVTLYPWMAAFQRQECMRRWLQAELCMSEAQARSVLSRCPALGELDVRLARRRLRQLDRQLGVSKMDAALLVLRRPAMLLPAISDVVSYAVGRTGPALPG